MWQNNTLAIKPPFGLHWKRKKFASGVFCMGLVHWSRDPQTRISTNYSLKLGLTALFIHVKIILLHHENKTAIAVMNKYIWNYNNSLSNLLLVANNFNNGN